MSLRDWWRRATDPKFPTNQPGVGPPESILVQSLDINDVLDENGKVREGKG